MLKQFFDKLTHKPDPVRMYSAGISDVGRRRKLNEDNFLIDEKLGLFIVADGMGGHDAGEVASKLAIETIFNHIKKMLNEQQEAGPTRFSSVLQDAIEEANNQAHCYNIAKGLTEGRGMGTTVTGFWIDAYHKKAKKQLHAFNVGDSRTYRFADNTLQQLSTDHSHYQLWLDTGREGTAPKHNIIYKAIGPWQRIVAEQQTIKLHKRELFLLCSDGLCDMLSHAEIEAILKENKSRPLNTAAQALIDAANEAGGKDNVTVVLVKPEI